MLTLVARIAAIVALLAAALYYVTAPPKGEDGYADRAALTVEALRSQVQTARIWAETLGDGETTRAAAAVAFREAEHAASGASSNFEPHEPPPGMLELRSDVVKLASETTDALAALRIAAQQERWDEIGPLSEPLPKLAEELARLEERALG